MAVNPQRGEIWLVDLGYVAKVRPCLVLNIPIDDNDRALINHHHSPHHPNPRLSL